jgi:hypothetical protein
VPEDPVGARLPYEAGVLRRSRKVDPAELFPDREFPSRKYRISNRLPPHAEEHVSGRVSASNGREPPRLEYA